MKKAQVSLFLILGLVIIFSASLVYYIKSQYEDVSPVVLQEQKDEIDLYVEGCIEQHAQEALMLIGQQGGFINIPADVSLDADSQEVVYLAEGGIVPSWLFQDNQGSDRSHAPVLDKGYDGDGSIQDQVEQYILDNIDNCLDSFAPFLEEYDHIKNTGEISIQTDFNEEDTQVTLTMPLSLKKGGEETTKKSFSKSLDVRMRKIYSLASGITKLEKDEVFLERNTRNLIFAYSRVDPNYLPPISGGLHFLQCQERVQWNSEDVKAMMQDMLLNNIPYLRIQGTANPRIIVSPQTEPDEEKRTTRQGVFDNMRFSAGVAYPEMFADFSYQPDFPLDMDLGASQIEPNSYELNLVFDRICMMQYKTSYDLKYPVLVTIMDEGSSLDNSPYIFQFPLQSVILDNFPRVRLSDVVSLSEDPQDYYPNRLCKPEERVSGDATIKVTDIKGKPVAGAGIYFQCGPEYVTGYDDEGRPSDYTAFSKRCFIAKTSENGEFEGRLPMCIGGSIITISKKDYLDKKEFIGDVLMDKPLSRSITLTPIKPLSLTIQKYALSPPPVDKPGEGTGVVVSEAGEVISCSPSNNPAKLSANEQAILRMEKLDSIGGVSVNDPIILYSPQNSSEIRLAPGEYSVDILLMRNEKYQGEMTIYKDSTTKEFDNDELGGPSSISYPDEDIPIPSIISGGSIFRVNITQEMLDSGNKITFFVFDEGKPQVVDEVAGSMRHRQKCSDLNRKLLLPKID